MTPEQETTLVKLYSTGFSYWEISQQLAIPTGTLASCIRRKYKNLQSQVQAKYQLLVKLYTNKFKQTLDVSDTTAQAIFESLFERFQNKRRNAKVEFNLKFSDVEYPTHCPLLGIKLDYLTTQHRADDYPTFDRIDNSKGYIPGNVHVVSWRANRIKNDSTPEELIKIGTSITNILANASKCVVQ